MRVKLFGYHLILDVFFPADRQIKWLPAIRYGYVKSGIRAREDK